MSQIFPIQNDPRFRILTATGGQTVFAIGFPFQANADIKVLEKVDDRFVEIAGGFTVTGAGNPAGGTLTFAVGREEDEEILILGSAVLERLSSIVLNGRFSSKATDDELDRNRLIQQEVKREVDRAVKTSYGEDAPTIDLGIPDGAVLIKQGDRLTAGPTGAAINSAQGYAEAAGLSAGAAASSATNAGTSAGAALASRNKAQQWAEEDEDTEVEPGAYSAKHWAAKAEQVVLDGLVDASVTIPKLATDVVNLIAGKIAFLASGTPLPSSNIGPIWHADYAAIMTWRTFSANGAAYTGYASLDIGAPRLDGQSAPRTGWLKRNGASYSKTTYAPLWNWALHNGRVVALGSWAAGAFVFADNGDGTFKLPDSRGEFERIWDDGRGVDSGRVFGSSQLDQLQGFRIRIPRAGSATSVGASAGSAPNGAFNDILPADDGTNGTPRTGLETRPRNVALLGTIKF